jgi:hypothetical protein
MIHYEDISRFKNAIGIAKKIRIILCVLFLASAPFYLVTAAPITFKQIQNLDYAEQVAASNNFLLAQAVSAVLLAIALLFIPVPMIMGRIVDGKYMDRIKRDYFPTPETAIGLKELMKVLSVQEPDLHRLGLDKSDRRFAYADFVIGFNAVKKLDAKWDKTRKFRIGVKF